MSEELELKSIRDLPPLEEGGRHARQGFIYQDHVGAMLAIEMLAEEKQVALWFETHDDITAIRRCEDLESVEFIQVKANNPTSRWSIANITARDGDGDSLVEKSLRQSRCSEDTAFRIVSLYDVTDDLAILKSKPGSDERVAMEEEETAFAASLVERLGEVSSEDGTDLSEWVRRTYWHKAPDSVESLVARNIIALEELLDDLDLWVSIDQRTEIYQRLVAKVQAASTTKDYAIQRAALKDWLVTEVNNALSPTQGGKALTEKLTAANLDSETIRQAAELRLRYRQARMRQDYIEPGGYGLLEGEICSRLHHMKVTMDAQDTAVDSEVFHKECLDAVVDVARNDLLRRYSIPESLATGFMYELTGRCTHRFVRA